MNFLNKLFGTTPSVDDEPFEVQIQDALEFLCPVVPLESIEKYLEFECDTTPGSSGPFGYCLSNPIPVNGVIGEYVYLNRLLSKGNRKFFYHRIGSFKSDTVKHPVDKYELVSVDGSEWLFLYLCPYFPRRSRKMPKDLSCESWTASGNNQEMEIGKMVRSLWKCPLFGVNVYLSNFPSDLPKCLQLKYPNDPEIGRFTSSMVQRIFNHNKCSWIRPTDHIQMNPNEKLIFQQTQNEDGIIYF